jgi:hypothetical protein
MLVLVLSFILEACGGSGGGSKPSLDLYLSGNGFYLQGVSYGRALRDADGCVAQVISPASLVEVDPLTGKLKDGYPQPLLNGGDLEELYAFQLTETASSTYEPTVVPRNGAVVLIFTASIDPECLLLDEASRLTELSPIGVRTASGVPVPVQVTLADREVILDPVTGGAPGFPAGPRLFDKDGNPTGYPGGYLQLTVVSAGTGENTVLAKDGRVLCARVDLLGAPAKPIGFNPGNDRIDFMSYEGLSFNGCLPDLVPPRIMRIVDASGVTGSGSHARSILDPLKRFNTLANNGQGEWAGALLILRPGQADEERARVSSNDETALYLENALALPPVEEVDAYTVERAEYYEPLPGPDPATAVDPAHHPRDPFDPEDEKNSDLFRFVQYEARNEADGTWESVAYDPGPEGKNPVHPEWRIKFRFSEPMALASFRPFESFYVCSEKLAIENPGFGAMKPGRVTADRGHSVMCFEPVVDDLFSAGRMMGFGGKPKALRLVIRVRPPAVTVQDFYFALPEPWPEGIFDNLHEEGVLGIMDLGGRPLGLPACLHDPSSPYCLMYADSPAHGAYTPAADLKLEFNTQALDPKEHPETGALVHRFMGLPKNGAGGIPPITGALYNDHKDMIYGPHMVDVSIGLNGWLSGHPVDFIEHVFDNIYPPPPSSPTAPDPIFLMPVGLGTPVNKPNGCRFQHVYRRGDASPNVIWYEGTRLDLTGLAWAPAGGWVTNSLLEKMSIAVSYSDVVPLTTQKEGRPLHPDSGLGEIFRENHTFYDQQMVVGKEDDGVPYFLDWRKLYLPKNPKPGANRYLSFPEFHQSFGYDSTRSMLIEYRMDPNRFSGVYAGNSFSYHAGIMSSLLPRFRVFDRGKSSRQVYAATRPDDYPRALGPATPPGDFGDNSRYFMIFNYVKRVSLVQSPFLTCDVDPGLDLVFVNPVVDPPLDEIAEGARLTLRFQSAGNGVTGFPASPWKFQHEVEELNEGASREFNHLRFEAVFEADVEAGIVPAIDTVVCPYRLVEQTP